MKEITIFPDATIREAMKVLDKTAEKVLLVVDAENKLVGTLSDGDIRRDILKRQKLSDSIEKAYNRNPFFVFETDINKEEIKTLFTVQKINLIPVLNSNRQVVDYITWETFFGDQTEKKGGELVAPVVIMAGGKGTRLEPFTRVLPKPLIPVGGKPLIDHIIDRFRYYGAQKFYITLNHMSKIMRAYFEEKSPDYLLDFVEEEKPCGTAGGLTLLVDKLDGPFFVSNCDILIEADYLNIYEFHKNNKHDITLVASTKNYNIPYGVCELNHKGELDKINEKPEYSFLVNTGLYVLNPEMIKYIPENQFFHITQLITYVKSIGGSIGVYPVSEKAWIDFGQWEEYRKALKMIEGL